MDEIVTLFNEADRENEKIAADKKRRIEEENTQAAERDNSHWSLLVKHVVELTQILTNKTNWEQGQQKEREAVEQIWFHI